VNGSYVNHLANAGRPTAQHRHADPRRARSRRLCRRLIRSPPSIRRRAAPARSRTQRMDVADA